MIGGEKVPIVCPYCGFGCRIYAIKKGNRIQIEFVKDNPTVNQGSLCPKGIASLDYVLSKDRLKAPLKVSDRGKFTEISWKKAIEIVSKNIKEIAKKQGPEALGFISSAKCTNEENYLMQKIARMMGTNNVDHCARLCHASTIVGLAKTVGAAAQSGSYLDISKANAILIWGYNPAETHPVAMRYILAAKDNGARIILVDPRRTKTGWFADYVLRLIPGSDVALANAIMNVIISENLYDASFVNDRLVGFEQLAEHVAKYTPESVENITGVDADLIRDAART
ncbi:MAG TPA: formate dehydrogenase subunit alpha, partial [Euryarchaeota archaeon]|nr:formate dehydrogenase subunit alpha [Euryarchaeota archaeon]